MDTATAITKNVTEEQAKRISEWETRASRMYTAKNYYSQNWRKYEEAWKMMTKDRTGEDSWRADIPESWSYATVKTAQAAFSDSEVKPVFVAEENEDRSKARDKRELYQDIAEKGELQTELYFARLDAFKLGTAFIKTSYIKDSRKVQEIDSFDPDTGKVVYKEGNIDDFDDPKTERISPYLMLVDEMATFNVNSARRMIQIEILGKDDAKRIYGHLDKNFDADVKSYGQIQQLLTDAQSQKIAETADTNTGLEVRSMKFFAPFELEPDYVVIWHCWDRVEDTYEIIANGFPLRVKADKELSPIPYIHKQIPYTAIRFSPYSGDEFWGAGIIEIGRSTAKAIEKFTEMMDDRQKVSLFSPAFTDVTDEIDQRVFALKPLSLIPTKGGVPHQYQVPGITNADLALKSELEKDFQRVVGINESSLGISPTARMTATEVAFLRESALRRLRDFAFLYKEALRREVKLKLSLFKQYYSNPLKQEPKINGDEHMKEIAKQFKSKTGNVYRLKSVSKDLFNDEVDIDIDMQVLVPMTQAQLITKWSQVIRDVAPFANVLDVDMTKIYDEYLSALEVNINSLKVDTESDAIEVAEDEHKLLASDNTTKAAFEVLQTGTPLEFLNVQHIKRHRELLRGEETLSPEAEKNIALHIAADMQNLKKKALTELNQAQQAQASPNAQPSPMNPRGNRIATPNPMPGIAVPNVPNADLNTPSSTPLA